MYDLHHNTNLSKPINNTVSAKACVMSDKKLQIYVQNINKRNYS
jgi:hypothetical protein